MPPAIGFGISKTLLLHLHVPAIYRNFSVLVILQLNQCQTALHLQPLH
jgi:hypothetical protein